MGYNTYNNTNTNTHQPTTNTTNTTKFTPHPFHFTMSNPPPATYTEHSEDTSVQRAGLSMKDDAGDYKKTADGRTNDLAGIGNVSGTILKEAGYENSYNVLAQFLMLNMDEDLFCEWLEDATEGNCNIRNRKRCFAGLWLYSKTTFKDK